MGLTALLDRPLLQGAGFELDLGSLLLGLLVLAVSGVLARGASRGLRRLIEANGGDPGAGFALAKAARYGILGCGAVLALNAMGLPMSAVTAGSAALLVGVGFGLQTIAQNFVSGLMLLVERPIGRGDLVRVGEFLGTVEDIKLRATWLRTRDGARLVVPNNDLTTRVVINYSAAPDGTRLLVPVGVAAVVDPRQVAPLVLAAARAHPKVLAKPGPEFLLSSFGAAAHDCALSVWIRDPRDEPGVASDLRFELVRALREAGIELAPPAPAVPRREPDSGR